MSELFPERSPSPSNPTTDMSTQSVGNIIEPVKYFTMAPIDRDFQRLDGAYYGNGLVRVYFYQNLDGPPDWKYTYVKDAKFSEDGTTLELNCVTNIIKVKQDPSIEDFKTIIYNEWVKWDAKCGQYDEDRTDFEPWGHISLEAIAHEHKCLSEEREKKLCESVSSKTYSFPDHLYFSEAPWRK